MRRYLKTGLYSAAAIILLYVSLYSVNSRYGGYWMVPEHKVDIVRGEVGEMLVIQWQPYVGMDVKDSPDWLAVVNRPLMRLDRKYVHKSHLVIDDKFLQWLESLKDDEVHPIFRIREVAE